MSIERKGRVVLLGSIVFYLSTRDKHTLAYVLSQRPNSFNLFGARNNNPTKSYIILFDFVCCGYRPTQGRSHSLAPSQSTNIGRTKKSMTSTRYELWTLIKYFIILFFSVASLPFSILLHNRIRLDINITEINNKRKQTKLKRSKSLTSCCVVIHRTDHPGRFKEPVALVQKRYNWNLGPDARVRLLRLRSRSSSRCSSEQRPSNKRIRMAQKRALLASTGMKLEYLLAHRSSIKANRWRKKRSET